MSDQISMNRVSDSYDYHDAMIQIEMLFQSHILSFGYKEYSLETFVDKKYFADWKGNEGNNDTDEMREGLHIDGILASADPSENEILTYLQYTLNIAELCRRAFNRNQIQGYNFDIRNYTELLSRIREILKRLKYEVKYIPEKEFIFLVPHDPAADAVALLNPSDMGNAITAYNSFTLSGKLDEKRQILDELGKTIEEFTDNMEPANASLFRHIEFLLGSVNIRNNNKEGEAKIDRVAAMGDKELEKWYDEAYQMMLLRILQHDNEDRVSRVRDLEEECGYTPDLTDDTNIGSFIQEELKRDRELLDRADNVLTEAEERAEERDSERTQIRQNNHTVRNVVVAVIVADILFIAFILCYFFFIA